MSASAGSRRCRREYSWTYARYCPCLGVKVFAQGLTSAIRFSCSAPRRGTRGSPERPARGAQDPTRADFAGCECRRQLRGNTMLCCRKVNDAAERAVRFPHRGCGSRWQGQQYGEQVSPSTEKRDNGSHHGFHVVRAELLQGPAPTAQVLGILQARHYCLGCSSEWSRF